MSTSTVTDKGQTTVPQEIRQALGIKPRAQLVWRIQKDGTAVVQPRPSALLLFGSLKPKGRKYRGRDMERRAMSREVGKDAAAEGLR